MQCKTCQVYHILCICAQSVCCQQIMRGRRCETCKVPQRPSSPPECRGHSTPQGQQTWTSQSCCPDSPARQIRLLPSYKSAPVSLLSKMYDSTWLLLPVKSHLLRSFAENVVWHSKPAQQNSSKLVLPNVFGSFQLSPMCRTGMVSDQKGLSVLLTRMLCQLGAMSSVVLQELPTCRFTPP